MALANWGKIEQDRKEKEAYEIFMSSPDSEQKLLVKSYIRKQMLAKDGMQKKLDEYQKFFATLQTFLPKPFTTSTIIG